MVGKTKRPDRSGTAKGDGSPDKSAETERSGKRQHVEEKSRTSLGGRGGAAEDPPRVVAAGGMVVSLLSSAVPVGSKLEAAMQALGSQRADRAEPVDSRVAAAVLQFAANLLIRARAAGGTQHPAPTQSSDGNAAAGLLGRKDGTRQGSTALWC
ncbi:hypothetical protein T484DRAFT_1789693 [Baffinella frigidus]|nr:hypothetical protein T484DRAFT_1789693 [Cryptophyta sp. CCMP2293]